jgi:signal transduction histidine kinase
METHTYRVGPELDPLGAPVLAVINEGATPAEIVDRFRTLGAAIDPSLATALLERLTELGLLCVTSMTVHGTRYGLTALGQQCRGASWLAQQSLTEELQELERLRTDLLTTVGHELRTPLTVVRTCVGLLLDPTAPPDPSIATQLLQTIERSADRMQRLLTDLLDLARFRAGRLQLQAQRIDAVQLAEDAASVIRPQLQAQGQTIALALPPTPIWVFGDRRRLEQVLLNLLSNAQKFSPPGGVVRLSVTASGDEVRWAVTDQGPGISREDQPRLFERFFTTASRTDRERSGVGLGLPISLAIARAHGGTIDVETTLGQGSTFTARVPLQRPIEAEAE